MKTRKTYRYMSFIILPIVVILMVLFFSKAPQFLFYPYIGVNWVALLTVAFFILSPWGNIRLQSKDNPGKLYSLSGWWLRVALLQISLTLVYIGLYTFCYRILPIHNGNVSLSMTLDTLWKHWLVYPWGIVTIVTIALAYTAYNLKRNAFVSSTVESLLHNKDDSLITHLVGICPRNAIVAAVSMTFGLYALLIACMLVSGHTNLIAQGMKTNTFVVALLMLVFAILPFVKSGIRRLMRRQIPSIIGIVSLLMILAVVVLILSGVINSIPLPNQKQSSPIYYNDLMKLGYQNIWLLFSTNWWLAYTPICALIIGRISKGYSIRTVALGILIGPAIIAAIPHIHTWLSPLLLMILIGAGFLIFFGMLSLKQNRSMLVHQHIPKNGVYKSRDYHFFFRRVFRFSCIAVYFYLPIGIMYIALMLYFAATLSVVVYLLTAISVVMAVIKGRVVSLKTET